MDSLLGTLAAIIGGYIGATYWGPEFGVRLFQTRDYRADAFYGQVLMACAGACVGMIAYRVALPILGAISSPLRKKGGGASIWKTVPGRKVIGFLCRFPVGLVSVWPVAVAVIALLTLMKPPLKIAALAVAALLLAGLLAPKTRRSKARRWIAMVVNPLRRVARSMQFGLGGSSRFAGIVQEWLHPWQPGSILLGGSIYDGGRVGVADDRHFITIATSRSGKGRSGIIPNLLTWPGSALVIDPKGQNAAVTAPARKKMGQTVYIIDPFYELNHVGVTMPIHRFNPLAELDPTDREFAERVSLLGDALVVRESTGGNSFWDDAAESIINGLIAHAVTWPGILPEQRTLGLVRDWLIRPEGLPLTDMGKNSLSGMARAAAAFLKDNSANTISGVMATARTHTKWLDSEAMREVFSKSDFSLQELKAKPTSLFVVLPTEYLDIHARFLRLFVNACLHSASRGAKPRHSMLFILDEFYALGRLSTIAKAAGALAGYRVKLWPIVQNLTQLQELYPHNWETFMGNAGLWQVFAVNDMTTAKYLSERLGQHVRWSKTTLSNGVTEWMPVGVSPLRAPVELAQETSRMSGRQLIFIEGGDCLFLNRLNYDQVFRAGEYAPDPYETVHPVGN